MKKWSLFVLMACLLSFAPVGIVNAAENGANPTKPTLTEQQKTELAAMHKEVMEKEKAIIAKYVEFGVMSRQAADMLQIIWIKGLKKSRKMAISHLITLGKCILVNRLMKKVRKLILINK